jgi:hypothetical protein
MFTKFFPPSTHPGTSASPAPTRHDLYAFEISKPVVLGATNCSNKLAISRAAYVSAIRVLLAVLALFVAEIPGHAQIAVAASSVVEARTQIGPAVPGLAKPVQEMTFSSPRSAVKIKTATETKIKTKIKTRVLRYGGRVQKDGQDRWVVDGSVIGLETVNIAPGQDAVFDTTLPSGLTSLELRGRFVVPVAEVASTLEIGVSGETPQQVASSGDRTFSAPTQFSASSGSSTEYVEFTARSHISGSCVGFQASQIDRVQVVAGGIPRAPTMLADFFPVFLDRLIVRIDANASSSSLKAPASASFGSAGASMRTGIDESVAQTVLMLTTFVVKRWPAAQVVVTDQAIAMTPYDRQIDLRVGSKGSIALEDLRGQSMLVMSGPKSHLPALAEYLASPAFEIAFARSVQTEGKAPVVPELGHVLTIGDLRGRSLLAKGFGSVDQSVTVTQSQLGGQVQSIAVKITGVAQVAGTGRLVVQLRANDQVLATKRVANDEPFTLKGTISRSALARDNVVIVRASELSSGSVTGTQRVFAQRALGDVPGDLAPDPVNCGEGRPEVTLQLDSGSQFSATMGRGLPAGFDRFPQALVNGFDVRFTRLQLGELQAAADVVQLLQGLSVPRLIPKVYGPNRKHSVSRPMLFVGTPNKELSKLDAPIVPDSKIRPGELPISALQGFAATGDDHLVLVTNGSSANVASMLVGLKADLQGWRSLRGDVLVKQNGRVRNIRVRPSLGLGEEKGRTVHHSRLAEAMRFGLGLGAALALFGLVVSRLFGRRQS